MRNKNPVLILLIVSLLCTGCKKNNTNETETNQEKIVTHRKKTETITFSTAFLEDSNEYKRMNIIYTECFKRLGYEFELSYQPAKRALFEANTGNIDGDGGRIYSLNYNQDFPDLIRIDEPVLSIDVTLFTDDDTILLNSWSELENTDYILAVQIGVVIIKKRLEEHKIDPARILYFSDMKGVLHMLFSGRIDMIIDSQYLVSTVLKSPDFENRKIFSKKIDTFTLYPYINKQHTNILKNIEQILKEVKEDGEIQKKLANIP